jgi:effector-binding domain-containing protein
MSDEVTVKDVPAVRAAAMQVETSPQTIGEDLGRAYGAVMAYMGARGLAASDVPLCFYRSWEQDNWVIEAGVPVEGEVMEADGVHLLEIPGGEAATVLHVGPYMELGRAHAALAAWCQEHGREMVASYERYITDPEEVPDPAQYQTEVIWPLRAA